MCDQLVAETAICTTHNKHKRRKSMFLAGFELPDSSNELIQTVALDRKATGFVNKINVRYDNECFKHYNGDILVIHTDTFQFYCTNY
jgi:hypothetical protein